jgi:Photosynthesis system II assembly factor YCF48/Putative zinc-finger
MQKIPQIVSERLKAGAAVSGHPDAELLTAFAEHSLSERERARILGHLADCGDCREIVALALPAMESGEYAYLPHRRSSFTWRGFTWPALRWGFATAGAAVIVFGIVEFEHHRPTNSAMVAKQVAAAPVTTQLQNQAASETASAVPAPPQQLISDDSTTKKVTRQIAEGESRLHRKLNPAQPQSAPPASTALALMAKSPATPVPPASQMVAVQVQNQTVDVESANAQAAPAPVPNSFVDQSLSYNTGPMSRAKPASIQPVQSGVAGTMLASAPRWSITAVGGLQRSLDQGKSWQDISVDASALPSTSSTGAAIGGPIKTTVAKQNAVHAEAFKLAAAHVFFRTVAAAGNEVWAGGSSAALFHSLDGGEHWTRVLPSFSGAMLSGDVTSVEFPDPQHGTVTTSTPEIWVTTDDGQTWQKQ